MTLSEIATRKPAKTNGTAWGSRISQRSWTKDMRIARDRSTASRGVASSPVTVETSSGKNAIRKVTVVRDTCPVPSATTRMGAMATTGVDCVTSSSG